MKDILNIKTRSFKYCVIQKLIEILLFTAGCSKFQIFFSQKQQCKAQVVQEDNQVFDLKRFIHLWCG